MKTRRVDAEGNNILLSGVIDENFKINPGNRILLDNGATFKGTQVGGQILYNDEYIVKVFSLTEAGEIELVPELSGMELDDAEADAAPRPSDFFSAPRSVGPEPAEEQSVVKQSSVPVLPPLTMPHQVSYPVEELSLTLPPKPVARSVTWSSLPPVVIVSWEQAFPRLSPASGGEEALSSSTPVVVHVAPTPAAPQAIPDQEKSLGELLETNLSPGSTKPSGGVEVQVGGENHEVVDSGPCCGCIIL